MPGYTCAKFDEGDQKTHAQTMRGDQYGLDYTQYIAPLIVGWQSHSTAIEELKRRNTELQEEINRVYIEIARIKDKLGSA